MKAETNPNTPVVTKGSASSMAFAFDDFRQRHVAVVVNHDGSGRIAIYNKASRLLAEVRFNSYENFRVIRDAVDSQAMSADAFRIRKAKGA